MIRLGGATALLALVLSGCSCGDLCGTNGCPLPDTTCSVLTGQCLDTSLVFGAPCTDPSDCHTGLCLTTGDQARRAVCTGTCEAADPPCPADFLCRPAGDGQGGVVQVCFPTGEGDIGEVCDSPIDCLRALCIVFTLEDGGVCTDDCDDTDLTSCGAGNVGCGFFASEEEPDEVFGLCVGGGSAGPGEACPGGLTQCDLSLSDTCLPDTTGNSFCAPICPGGIDDCTQPGACCEDLGVGVPAPFCLPPLYCGCEPDCFGRTCGPDGCSGVCGTCNAGEICAGGACTVCTLDCAGRQCGADGCGGVCGTCGAGEVCDGGTCATTCTPDCSSAVCGSDGCSGVCGSCTAPQVCSSGACVDSTLLLVDVIVRDLSLTPEEVWGLGEYTSPQSIAPPLTYGQGPQVGTTQHLLCGTDIVCSNLTALSSEVAYEVLLGYDLGAGRIRCVVTFTLHDTAAATLDASDCLVAGSGPFDSVSVSGDTATPATFSWQLP